MDPKSHWNTVYRARQPSEVSWFQAEPTRSLELLREVGANPSTEIIDVGGGDSTFVDAVIRGNLGRITVLDISGAALWRAQSRLGNRADDVTWIEADITRAELSPDRFDVWHDRAVFHFLTEATDRARYVALAASAVRHGGTVILATFALDGPTRCSGLDVVQYSPESLARELGDHFELVRGLSDTHRTPSGQEQRFTVAVLERR